MAETTICASKITESNGTVTYTYLIEDIDVPGEFVLQLSNRLVTITKCIDIELYSFDFQMNSIGDIVDKIFVSIKNGKGIPNLINNAF